MNKRSKQNNLKSSVTEYIPEENLVDEDYIPNTKSYRRNTSKNHQFEEDEITNYVNISPMLEMEYDGSQFIDKWLMSEKLDSEIYFEWENTYIIIWKQIQSTLLIY
jgi:hypothetical protein